MKLTQRLYHFFDEMVYYFISDYKFDGFICAVQMVPYSIREAAKWLTL